MAKEPPSPAFDIDEKDGIKGLKAYLHSKGAEDELDTVDGRLKSFGARWRLADKVVAYKNDAVSPEQLAKVGFFYLPDARFLDRGVCFCCKKALHSWEKGDDPLYEHLRHSPDCTFIQSVLADNVDMPSTVEILTADILDKGTLDSSADGSRALDSADMSDWTAQHGCTWPRHTAIDHLLICVHGEAMTSEKLQQYVATMRKNSSDVAGKYMQERPMMMAVDAIDWTCLKKTSISDKIAMIMLPSVTSLRDFANDNFLDILHYTSPKSRHPILELVVQLLNEKYREYVSAYPKFTGRVSLLGHSLGSIVAFDVLTNQKKLRGQDMVEGCVGEIEDKTRSEWRWPQLEFDVDNLFAVGSSLACFCTVRGDIQSKNWPHGAKGYTFPGGAKLFNIYHPADPYAYRFEPLLEPQRSAEQPVLVPDRRLEKKKDKDKEKEEAAMRRERVDFVLQNVSSEGYSQLIGALNLSTHYCYWDNRDVMLFLIDVIDKQQMDHDFFETEAGKSWLRECEKLMEKVSKDDTHGDAFLEGAGKELMEHFLQRDSESIMNLMQKIKHHNPGMERALRDGIEKRDELLRKGLDFLSQVRKKEKTKKILDDSRMALLDSSARDAMLGTMKEQVLEFLMNYLTKLEVPPIAGSKSFAAGEFMYAIGQIVLSGVTVPSQNLITTFSGRNVTVKASEVSAVLKGFTWMYKQKNFPYLKDSGGADADVKGLSLFLSFPLDSGELDTSVEATERVKIRHLDIRLQKTPVSWLYNTLLSIFSQRVRTAVEAALTHVLHEKIGLLSRALLPRASEYAEVALRGGKNKQQSVKGSREQRTAVDVAAGSHGEDSPPAYLRRKSSLDWVLGGQIVWGGGPSLMDAMLMGKKADSPVSPTSHGRHSPSTLENSSSPLAARRFSPFQDSPHHYDDSSSSLENSPERRVAASARPLHFAGNTPGASSGAAENAERGSRKDVLPVFGVHQMSPEQLATAAATPTATGSDIATTVASIVSKDTAETSPEAAEGVAETGMTGGLDAV